MAAGLRLATFNLLHGRSLDGALDRDRLRRAITMLDADVLAIQEVDRDQPRSEHRDLTAEVGQAMGAVAYRFVPTVTGTPGENWRPFRTGDTGPAYGIALLSRRPVTSWRTVTLAAAPIRAPVVVPGPRRPGVLLLRDEPRALIAAELDGLTVGATHLSFVPFWNRRQLHRACAALGAGPRILLGDLNLPGRLAASRGWERLATDPTWPAPRPKVQFDHVLAAGPIGDVLRVRTVQLAVSDHRAVIVELAER